MKKRNYVFTVLMIVIVILVISVFFFKTAVSADFNDVSLDKWYYKYINRVSELSLMNGVGDGDFSPGANLDRASCVRIISSYDSEDLEQYKTKEYFDDILPGKWYTASVNWARCRGIVKGISDTEFNPFADITRQDFLVILHKYNHYLAKYDLCAYELMDDYKDCDDISSYAYESLTWAVTNELIKGDENNCLNPKKPITRAEVACILCAYYDFAGGRPGAYPENVKYFTMSFDDATLQDERLIALMKKYNLRSTFFVSSGWLGLHDTLTFGDKVVNHFHFKPEEIKDVYKGFDVESHSKNHHDLSVASKDTIIYEVNSDFETLANLTSSEIKGFAYPGGHLSDLLVNTLVTDTPVKYARTVDSTGQFNVPVDFMVWNPTCHYRDANIMGLLASFVKSTNPKDCLMYMWGHSFEIDLYDDWEYIESVFEYISCRRGIEYLDNSQVYEIFSN